VYSLRLVRRARAPIAFLALLLAGSTATRARAAGEDELQVSARLGGANPNGNPLASWGPAAAVDVEYGVTDAWSARASATLLRHPVGAVKDVSSGGTLQATAALVGATYTFDVLRLVPYVEAGVGVVHWSGAGAPSRTSLAMEAGLGGDYLLTPRWSCGASAQYLFSPGELVNNAMSLGGPPLAFSLTLRVSRMF
jgi:Outer membrane protein beta-barrel domain